MGWSAEGIQRFNELYNVIKKDCKANKMFMETWLAERNAKSTNATKGQKRQCPQPQA
jgi:hypothetical protein